jgi:hypothetical protein
MSIGYLEACNLGLIGSMLQGNIRRHYLASEHSQDNHINQLDYHGTNIRLHHYRRSVHPPPPPPLSLLLTPHRRHIRLSPRPTHLALPQRPLRPPPRIRLHSHRSLPACPRAPLHRRIRASRSRPRLHFRAGTRAQQPPHYVRARQGAGRIFTHQFWRVFERQQRGL